MHRNPYPLIWPNGRGSTDIAPSEGARRNVHEPRRRRATGRHTQREVVAARVWPPQRCGSRPTQKVRRYRAQQRITVIYSWLNPPIIKPLRTLRGVTWKNGQRCGVATGTCKPPSRQQGRTRSVGFSAVRPAVRYLSSTPPLSLLSVGKNCRIAFVRWTGSHQSRLCSVSTPCPGLFAKSIQ